MMANEPTTQPIITSIEGTVLALKLDHLKEQMGAVVGLVGKMQETLQSLLNVEEQQRDFRAALDRAFGELKIERDARTILASKVQTIGEEVIRLAALRRWVVGGVVAGVGMMGVALFQLLILGPMQRGYALPSQPPQTMLHPNRDVP